MKVSEAMTQDVRVASPEETVQKAARTMASLDSGVLPVGEKDHLIGMITDRDSRNCPRERPESQSA